MKVLVTGGSGFIGKNIAESYLSEKYNLFIPKRNELDCSNDESVKNYLSNNTFDVIIHSAAKPGHRNANDHSDLLFNNSRMIFNLLKYNDNWGKFINMGSGAIYDMEHYIPKMKEDYFGTWIPKDIHGYNKYIFGKIFPTIKNAIDFRVFGIFGKHEDYAIRFISNAICKAIFNLPITLRQNRVFDYLFVDDLMPILDDFISSQNKLQDSYNITPTDSIELLKIAEMVKEISNTKSEILVGKEGLGIEYSGDNSRLLSEFPNTKFTPIKKAITELYEWYTTNKSSINQNELIVDK